MSSNTIVSNCCEAEFETVDLTTQNDLFCHLHERSCTRIKVRLTIGVVGPAKLNLRVCIEQRLKRHRTLEGFLWHRCRWNDRNHPRRKLRLLLRGWVFPVRLLCCQSDGGSKQNENEGVKASVGHGEPC